MNKGFVPVRKPGKLPYEHLAQTYDLEYGSSTIEIHTDAIQKGQKVVIVDDLLATGGTTKAIIDLIEKLGGEIVKIVYLIELEDLGGREVLKGHDIVSLLKY
jgi:adenine phosphoribosyltransferase